MELLSDRGRLARNAPSGRAVTLSEYDRSRSALIAGETLAIQGKSLARSLRTDEAERLAEVNRS
jgi:hypothetical protein